MPITLSESGNLGYYWYGSRSEKTYKSAAVVGNPRPFSGKADAGGPNPADECQLAFEYGEHEPGDGNQSTIIAQGPQWVEYVCAPPCKPDGSPVCICCSVVQITFMRSLHPM